MLLSAIKIVLNLYVLCDKMHNLVSLLDHHRVFISRIILFEAFNVARLVNVLE